MRAGMLLPVGASNVQVVVNFMSSLIGLWAVLYSNARATKLFLWSEVLIFLLARVRGVISIASPRPNHPLGWGREQMVYCALFDMIFGVYLLKVGTFCSALVK